MTVKIAFYVGPGDFFDKLVRWRTNSRASHCEIVFSDGWCFSASPRDGVRFKQIDFQAAPEHWEFVELPGVDEEKMRSEADRIFSTGAHYDWRGVLGFFAGKRWNDEGRWFCSEVCCHLAQVGGAFRFIEDPGISPDRLMAMVEARTESFAAIRKEPGYSFCEEMARACRS